MVGWCDGRDLGQCVQEAALHGEVILWALQWDPAFPINHRDFTSMLWN
jgi:hypothetical protein